MILLDTNVVVAFLNGEGTLGFDSQRLEFITGFTLKNDSYQTPAVCRLQRQGKPRHRFPA